MAKIATAAAVNVPGVVRQSGGLTRLTGRDLPRADISMGSDAVAINLFLAVSWPCSVTELTGRVRTEVGRSVESLTGLPLHDMNVMIAATEGSDDSCVSGVEIAEGPAQQALSDPIPPRVPSANPAAAVSAVVIACGLLALAFVVSREWFINRGTFESAPWIRNSVEWTSRLHWQPWLLPVAIAAVVAGVVLIMSAIKRRAKTHVPLGTRAHRRCGCGRLTLHVCAVATQRSFPASARLTPASTVNTSRSTSNRPVAIELNLPQPSTRRFGPTSRYCSGHCNFRLSCEKL